MEREIVFRTPPWGRLALGPFALFFWGGLCLFVQSCGHPGGVWDWCMDGVTALFLAALALLLSYGCLPHRLRLDFVRREYEETVGVFPLLIRRAGSFDDIRGVFVEEAGGAGRVYRVGLVWQGRRAAARMPADDGRYRFTMLRVQGAAEALAKNIAGRLCVPYEGLLPRYRAA